MINPKLKPGERVILLHMDGETSVFPGTWGTVIKAYELFGSDQYDVNWDNGSTLSLISGDDMWDNKVRKKKNIKEDTSNDFFMKNIEVFKYFNMKFLKKYLLLIRESGITNMYGAGPYLYMGRERIVHEFKYKDIGNEEAFEEVLQYSNQAQAEMINGVIDYLNDKGIEEDMSNINRYVQRFSTKIVQTYTFL
tara:strand:+ start:909 stop:1487 length:579 start_codon:yes stop_codon:yes gene_type:complete